MSNLALSKAAKRPRRRDRKETMWYIYILQCADGLLYTGSTTDIDRRVKEHNAKKGGGCTRARLPVKLVYKEPHLNRSEAQKREAQIKKWSRQKKLSLIYNDWPSSERKSISTSTDIYFAQH